MIIVNDREVRLPVRILGIDDAESAVPLDDHLGLLSFRVPTNAVRT